MTTLAEHIRSYGRDNLVDAVASAARACFTGGIVDFAEVDKAVLKAFPEVTVEELVEVWRELGCRQIAEAEELRRYAASRRGS